MAAHISVLLLVLLHAVVPHLADVCPRACECSSWLGTYIACRGTNMAEAPLNTYNPNVESLYFTYNKNMTTVRDDALYANNYASLRDLILNNNAVNNIEDYAFRGLSSLKQLDLSSNEIRTITQEVFQPLKRLTRLNLFGNKDIQLPDHGWALPKLSLLLLRGCGLNSIPLHFFENMPNLKSIKLDRNKFTEVNANVFLPVLKSLKILDLSINKFTRLPRNLLDLVPVSVELLLDHNRYNCDCEFVDSHCVYQRRIKKPRLLCNTPKKIRRVEGSDLNKYLNCGSEALSCVPQPHTFK